MGCLNVHAKRISQGLKVSCGLVCSVSTAKMLKVEPEYIFLMEANNYTEDVCVISNVKWHVS